MLTEDEAQKLQLTIYSSGWKDVIAPRWARRANAALKALALSPAERKGAGGDFKDTEDADLRAIIREAEIFLGVWHNELAAHRANRAQDELQRQQNGDQSPLIPTANP